MTSLRGETPAPRQAYSPFSKAHLCECLGSGEERIAGIIRRTGAAACCVEVAPRKSADSLQDRAAMAKIRAPFGRRKSEAPVRLLDEGPMGLGLLLDADAGAILEGGQGDVLVRRRQRGDFFIRPGGGDGRSSADEGKTSDQRRGYARPGLNSKLSTHHAGYDLANTSPSTPSGR